MGSKDWETPDDIFEYFNRRYHFTLDAAANKYNYKVSNYLEGPCDRSNECQCGICCDWRGFSVWNNPPYVNLEPWAIKWRAMGAEGVPIVALVLNATETDWFEIAWNSADIRRIVKKRINFKNSPTGNRQGSVIFEWNPPYQVDESTFIWDWKSDIGK